MRLRCRFADQDFTYRLLDNATSRDLVSLLPLDLTIEDFSTNEKLAASAAPAGRRRTCPLRRRGAGRSLLLPRLGQSRVLPRQLRLPWRPDPPRSHRGRGRTAAGARRVSPPPRTRVLKRRRLPWISSVQARPRPARDRPTGSPVSVRIDALFDPAAPDRVQGAQVTFEPGARTAWHTHPLGQTLIVTAGLGWVQREGGPVEEIRPGDVVWFAPGEKHWHGAHRRPAMTHIAIQEATTARSSTGWSR